MSLFKGCADGVHKFEARYDKSPAKLQEGLELQRGYTGMFESFRSVIYVHDICVRCGKVVSRPSVIGSGQ